MGSEMLETLMRHQPVLLQKPQSLADMESSTQGPAPAAPQPCARLVLFLSPEVPSVSLRATASVQELMAVPRMLAAAHSYSPASFLETLEMVSI